MPPTCHKLRGILSSQELTIKQQPALKKFVRRSTLSGEVEQKVDSTYVTVDNLEQVLLAKVWSKPKKKPKDPNRGQKIEASPNNQDGSSTNYNRKKNPLVKISKSLNASFALVITKNPVSALVCTICLTNAQRKKKTRVMGEELT